MTHDAKQDTSTTDGKNEFRTVEVIRDPDGVVAVITERVDNGRISFMFAREFEIGGQTKRSAYLNTRHLAAVQRLLPDLGERLELVQDQTNTKRRDK